LLPATAAALDPADRCSADAGGARDLFLRPGRGSTPRCDLRGMPGRFAQAVGAELDRVGDVLRRRMEGEVGAHPVEIEQHSEPGLVERNRVGARARAGSRRPASRFPDVASLLRSARRWVSPSSLGSGIMWFIGAMVGHSARRQQMFVTDRNVAENGLSGRNGSAFRLKQLNGIRSAALFVPESSEAAVSRRVARRIVVTSITFCPVREGCGASCYKDGPFVSSSPYGKIAALTLVAEARRETANILALRNCKRTMLDYIDPSQRR